MQGSDPSPPLNRGFVEAEIRRAIGASEVALLGELDLLDAPHLEGMSLSALAGFAMRQISQLPDPYKPLRMPGYPAVLAVWAVAHAQQHPDGQNFWGSLAFPNADPAQLGRLFDKALKQLGLATFPELFVGKQRYMGLARLHALVPLYAADNLLSQIERARDRGWTAAAVRAYLLQHHLCHDPVENLLRAVPDVACDLIERLTAAGQMGAAGLPLVPPHLRGSLAGRLRTEVAGTSLSAAVRGRVEQPAIWLDPDDGVIRIVVPAHPKGWSITAGTRSWAVSADTDGEWPVDVHEVRAQRGDWPEPLRLLDPETQVWAFDRWGRDHGGTLPVDGGLIVVPCAAAVEPPERVALDYGRMRGPWSAFRALQIRPGTNLTVLSEGKRHVVVAEVALAVVADPVVGLHTRQGGRVWDEAPRVTTGTVHVLDHLAGTSYVPPTAPGPLVAQGTIEIDITVAGRLGVRRHLDGLLIEGLVAVGLDRPLVPGERRAVHLELPGGWAGKVDATVDNSSGYAELTACAPDGSVYTLVAEPGIVAWSLREADQPAVWDVQALRVGPEALRRASMLAVRVGSLIPSRLQVRVGDSYALSLEPAVDEGLALFDIRSARSILDTNPGAALSFTLWLGDEHLTLLRVIYPCAGRVRHHMRTVALADLPGLLGMSGDEMAQAHQENTVAEEAVTAVRQQAVRYLLTRNRRHS